MTYYMETQNIHKKPLVLITGASTGLGLAVAKALIKGQRHRVILTAREKSLFRFEEAGLIEGPDIYIRPLDVTNADQRRTLIDECEFELGGLDVIINNAGVSVRSVIEHATAEDQMRQIDVNYIAPMRLVALALPYMRRRRSGRIVNISSAAGLMGMPTMACYCGSKFALEGGTEALWYEVKPWNIGVTLVIPGFIRSDAYEKTRDTRLSERACSSLGRDPYYRHYRCMDRFLSFMMRRAFATPERVADRIVALVDRKRPPLRLPVTIDAWFLYFFRKIVPRPLYHALLFRMLPDSEMWGRPRFVRSKAS